jgi:hypothetical protein
LHRSKTVLPFVPQDGTKTSAAALSHSNAAAGGFHLDAQNKVPLIMDDANLRKQAYHGTGCEKGSSVGGNNLETFQQAWHLGRKLSLTVQGP